MAFWTPPINIKFLHYVAANATSLNYVIEICKDVLDEEDGPMLIHGLKDLNNRKIILPLPQSLSPDQVLLEHRFEEFRKY